jgi:hypothetical protein
LNASPWCPTASHGRGLFRALTANSPEFDSADTLCHRSRVTDVVTDRDPLESETRARGRTGLRTARADRNVAFPRFVPLVPRSRFVVPACVRTEIIAGGFSGICETGGRPQAGGRAGRGPRRTRSAVSFHRVVRHPVLYFPHFSPGRRRITTATCNSRCGRYTPFPDRDAGTDTDRADEPETNLALGILKPVPRLQFTIFVQAAELFRTPHTSQASLDLQEKRHDRHGAGGRGGALPAVLGRRTSCSRVPRTPARRSWRGSSPRAPPVSASAPVPSC